MRFLRPEIAAILSLLLCDGCSGGQPAGGDVAGGIGIPHPAHLQDHGHAPTATVDCIQTKLSRQFDVAIHAQRYTDTAAYFDSCALRAIVQDKHTGEALDTLYLNTPELFWFNYTGCDSVISFTTGYRAGTEVSDNYYGDIVVADFNFDGRDDLAMISAAGGNGGPPYRYYLQSKDRTFLRDSFLTDSVSYFPSVIDKRRRRLITYVHAGACCMGEHVYRLDKATGRWKQVRHRILGR